MVWLALLIVFGIIIGNIMLVKHTAHMKMPSLKQRHLDEIEKQKRESDNQP
ncbi:DUF2897 family protein [Pseudidiomarina mangrovi]|uniref:DUF2897 family protein n=1 Tax=Pseudidiomarina mangrovi TaxID=2487133 RepID=UPI000FCAF4B3|nr:DUF2897 family protein [Pseudidiomarina mangrovi]